MLVEQAGPKHSVPHRFPMRHVVVLGLAFAVPGLLQAGDIYVGVHGSVDRLGVLYDKAVANANLATTAPGTAELLQSDASATKFSYTYGFLAGYKFPLSVSGVYLALEGDMARHGGAAAGRIVAEGAQAADSELGELLSEEWTLQSDRSFGLTARAGAGIPFFGTWFGPSVYVLAGARRLSGSFSTAYRGCFQQSSCSDTSAVSTVTEGFDAGFNGWTLGGGLETKMGMLSVRAEVRLTEFAPADGGVTFSQAITDTPVSLQPDSLSFGLGLVWYF